MSEPSAQRALVRELLERLDAVLQAAYVRAQALFERREAGEVRPWAYRGLYVSKEEAEQLFAREPAEPILSATEGNTGLLDAFGRASLWGDLGQHLELSAFDIAVTMLALAPEVDLRYGRLYAYLQDDITRKRPTVSLALDVLSPSADAKIAERSHFLPGAPLIRSGLLQLAADPSHVSPTLLDHYLKLDDAAVAHLLGQSDPSRAPSESFRVMLPAETVADNDPPLQGLLPLLVDAKTYLRPLQLYFHGAPGLGQLEAAHALAS